MIHISLPCIWIYQDSLVLFFMGKGLGDVDWKPCDLKWQMFGGLFLSDFSPCGSLWAGY